MKYIPNELLEAAAIDGAGSFGIFRKVVFPDGQKFYGNSAYIQFCVDLE